MVMPRRHVVDIWVPRERRRTARGYAFDGMELYIKDLPCNVSYVVATSSDAVERTAVAQQIEYQEVVWTEPRVTLFYDTTWPPLPDGFHVVWWANSRGAQEIVDKEYVANAGTGRAYGATPNTRHRRYELAPILDEKLSVLKMSEEEINGIRESTHALQGSRDRQSLASGFPKGR